MKRLLSLLPIPLLLPTALLLAGCSPFGEKLDGDGMVYYEPKSGTSTGTTVTAAQSSAESSAGSYTQITQDEAMKMMEKDDGHIVLDVRRQDEYDAGHIPGALLLPNEDIGTERPAELPDLDRIILIYCRSGNRSKQAAQKLYDMGYTHIYEFGGINTWTGEIVTGDK